MSPSLISLVAGLVGAVIGAGASIVTVMVQARIQDRRERHKQAVDLALEDYKIHFESAKLAPSGRFMAPVALYVDYHIRLAKLIESGELTPESYTRLTQENQLLDEALRAEGISTHPTLAGID